MANRTVEEMKRDAVGVFSTLKEMILEPEKFFGDAGDPTRDHEVILAPKGCGTCGDGPLCRHDGLQIRCPECKQQHAPKAVQR